LTPPRLVVCFEEQRRNKQPLPALIFSSRASSSLSLFVDMKILPEVVFLQNKQPPSLSPGRPPYSPPISSSEMGGHDFGDVLPEGHREERFFQKTARLEAENRLRCSPKGWGYIDRGRQGWGLFLRNNRGTITFPQAGGQTTVPPTPSLEYSTVKVRKKKPRGLPAKALAAQ
jgi:hypothetical protein